MEIHLKYQRAHQRGIEAQKIVDERREEEKKALEAHKKLNESDNERS